jgi:hypothetical protein
MVRDHLTMDKPHVRFGMGFRAASLRHCSRRYIGAGTPVTSHGLQERLTDHRRAAGTQTHELKTYRASATSVVPDGTER